MTVNEWHLFQEDNPHNNIWKLIETRCLPSKDDNASPRTSTWLCVATYMYKPTKRSLMAVSHQSRWTISLSEKGVYNRDSRNTNCSTRENLPIDASIVMVGLILTRRDRVQYCNRRQGNQKRMLFSRIGSATSHAENQTPRITKECNEHEWETWTKAPIKYVELVETKT